MISQWVDIMKLWSYWDYRGKFIMFPCYTQIRVNNNKYEYREREATEEELRENQW